ncbi:MAG: DUF86 domain-containing protein [bacterium]|nr:DUF86 domain-containing protein [bacterium]
MKNDQAYLNYILDSVRKIEKYTSDIDEKSFKEDELRQSGVLMQLTLIGEISKKISDETKNKVKLPWKDIIGFRDRAIHNYFDMKVDVIWDTVKNDIPILKKELSNN